MLDYKEKLKFIAKVNNTTQKAIKGAIDNSDCIVFETKRQLFEYAWISDDTTIDDMVDVIQDCTVDRGQEGMPLMDTMLCNNPNLLADFENEVYVYYFNECNFKEYE